MTQYTVGKLLREEHGANGSSQRWAVYRNGAALYVANGDKSQERSEYVLALVLKDRSPDEERFFQKLLAGDRAADAELRVIVGAQPRSTVRRGRVHA